MDVLMDDWGVEAPTLTDVSFHLPADPSNWFRELAMATPVESITQMEAIGTGEALTLEKIAAGEGYASAPIQVPDDPEQAPDDPEQAPDDPKQSPDDSIISGTLITLLVFTSVAAIGGGFIIYDVLMDRLSADQKQTTDTEDNEQ